MELIIGGVTLFAIGVAIGRYLFPINKDRFCWCEEIYSDDLVGSFWDLEDILLEMEAYDDLAEEKPKKKATKKKQTKKASTKSK